MELTENDIYNDLGLTPPAPEGNEPGGAPAEGDPAGSDPTAGGDPAPSQGPAPAGDPAPQGNEPGGVPAEGGLAGSDPTAGGDPAPAQTPAPSPAPQPAQPHRDPVGEPGPAGPTGTPLDQLAPPEVRGRTNPYTGKPVLTAADYAEYQKAYNADLAAAQQRQQEEAMRAAGLDPTAISSLIQQAVANDPAVQEAKAFAKAAKAREAEAQRKAAMGWYGEQIKAINELDPGANIKDLNDLAARDQAAYASMMERIRHGTSLVDAYKLANYDRLLQASILAAEQKVRNQAAGKAHMAPLGGKTGPAEDVTVPAEVMAQYHELFPNMSEADIRKEYAACQRAAANT